MSNQTFMGFKFKMFSPDVLELAKEEKVCPNHIYPEGKEKLHKLTDLNIEGCEIYQCSICKDVYWF